MPRSNPFTKALTEAEKRLAKALNERAMAQEKMNDLSREIPALQQTIQALQVQLGKTLTVQDVSISPKAIALMEQSFTAPIPPENLITEEDLLPDAEGTPLTPED